ncbi:MAG: type I polyketide synthase [Alphaproteobacteria bacterium]|nr:type I polyketide synthase [Alphaproteobacteria bacterium]
MERIAIIGIGCRFPGGADDAASFWNMLSDERSRITEIPPRRWSLEGFFDPRPDLPNRSYSRWGGFLSDIRSFDAAYFGLSPREADAMDPQQRLLLMAATEAVFDARLPMEELRRRNAGVFVGVSNIDYGLLQRYRTGHGDRYAGTGTALSIVANRVSNRLDLRGPSMGVDTACSSSLVAVDTACRHLAGGSCDIALAGGVNVLFDPRMFITFSRAHMLSPTGRIRAFDAAADGFVRGEGVGVVVLRRYEDALAAGDRIYAAIDASAVNQDGRTGAITEPSLESQMAMMRSLSARAGIDPACLDYVEAHGTGTFVGDPIEANAIGTVFGSCERDRPLPIGSVKTNIGHLEPAAGIAGLIKTALALFHRRIPASLGYETPNPAIDFDALGIAVADKPVDLNAGAEPLRALVNSFGFGGTNAGVLLSSAEAPGRPGRGCVPVGGTVPAAMVSTPTAVPLSAPTPQHLQRFAACLAQAIDSGSLAGLSVGEVGAAIAAQHDHAEHRAVIIAATPAELREKLVCLAEGRAWPAADRHAPPEIITGRARTSRKLVFTMTGQGGQWWAMGRELFECEPVFRQSIEAFDSVFKEIGGWSVVKVLLADEETSNIHDAAITPAVMFAFQTGLAEVWRARGVRPDIVLGHSFGEVTAAYLAGGIGQAAVAALVTHRGLIRGHVDRVGTMAAIGLGAETIEPMLPADGGIEIGGYNSPHMVTLTGEERAIDELIQLLNEADPTILTRKLALDFAYHSSWFTPVEHIFKADVGELDTAPAKLPVISTVTGELNDRFDADYWWQNLRYPVRYQQAVERALELGGDTFIELGPHRTLSSMTAACAAAKGQTVTTVSSLDKRWGDRVSVAVATGQLYVAGVDIDWPAIQQAGGRTVTLPRRPWILQELWSEPEEAARVMRPPAGHPLLGRRDPGPVPSWSNEVSLTTHGYLGDHRLDGECVFPAAAYLDMLTAAARDVLDCEAIELIDIAFPAALYIGADDVVQLRTAFDRGRRRLTISSRLRDGAQDWQQRSAATVYPLQAAAPGEIRAPLVQGKAIERAEFYRAAEANGFGWGPQFQGLCSILAGPGGASARIVIAEAGVGAPTSFALDPRTVDCALQLMLACDGNFGADGLIPVGIDRVAVTGALAHECRAAASTRASGKYVIADVTIFCGGTAPVVTIGGIRTRANRGKQGFAKSDVTAPRYYGESIEAVAVEASKQAADGTWLLFGGDNCALSGRIGDALGMRGEQVSIRSIAAGAAEDPRTYLDAFRMCFERSPVAGIVYALPLARSADRSLDIADAATANVIAATGFAQAIAQLATDEPLPRISVLTHNALAVGGHATISASGLAQSALHGLFRTVAMEAPEATLQLIDIDESGLRDTGALIDILTSTSRESELSIRAGRIYATRLGEVAEHDLIASRVPLSKLGRSRNFKLRHTGAPGADGVCWQVAQQAPLGPDDVGVEVRAVGLNFRDVMAVSGLLPEQAEPSAAIEALGLELSGVVVARGENVRSLDIGDYVFGMGRGAFQRRVNWPSLALHRVPAGLTHCEAAAIPSAYLTAHHALNKVARLAPGESILIHSATGGGGLAAIALARRARARIFATAGSDEKRTYLRGLGIAHVFNSRSLGFADEVMRATDGQGVDVVLNSLGGAFIDKSLSCLAPYGRFLELGKRDVYCDSPLGLRGLRSNVSFHVIDVAALIAQRPLLAAGMLDEVSAMLAGGEIDALPVSRFGAADVGNAFRLMAEAKHIGKVVVELDDADLPVESGLRYDAPLDPEGTYLVTGGAGGFGCAVGEWLSARGAGRVVLASRSAQTGAQQSEPARIETLRLDVTDAGAVASAIHSLAACDKPLRGIVHAAVVYDDALLTNMTAKRIRQVLAPKIAGGLNLTRALEGCGAQLDFFVSFSSLAQVVGWAGQSNYAAANSFLDGLAHWQRSRGIPGICINWGALEESGHVARSEKMQSYLASAGWIGIDNETALAALAKAIDFDRPTLTIAAADWTRLAVAHPVLARSPRTAGLVSAGDSAGDPTSRGLTGLHGDELEAAALQLVRSEAAKVLRMSAEDLVSAETLDEAGIDSLSAFELRLRIEQQLRLEVPMSRYARATRFVDLAALCRALVEEARARER